MSRTNRNFLIAYMLLVALPIVGLVGVLKSGRALTAPISLDGIWQMQTDPARLASMPCGKTLGENPDTALAISQSGKNFTLTLANGPKSAASGVIDGTTIKASVVPAARWAEEAGCAGHEISILARIDPTSDPRSLSGKLSVSDCPSCGVVDFHAVRLGLAEKKGLH